MEAKRLPALRTRAAAEVWAVRIAERRNSGMPVAQYCAEKGLCEQTFYRWQKRLYKMAQQEEETCFAEIHTVSEACRAVATVRINGIEADIYNGIDEYTLNILTGAMKSC